MGGNQGRWGWMHCGGGVVSVRGGGVKWEGGEEGWRGNEGQDGRRVG